MALAPIAAVRRHAAPVQRFANGAAWFFIVVSLGHLVWVVGQMLGDPGLVTLYQTNAGGEVHRAVGLAYDGLPGLLQALAQMTMVTAAAVFTLLPWRRGRRIGHVTLVAWAGLWAANLAWLASLDGQVDSFAQSGVATFLLACTALRALGGWTPRRTATVPVEIEFTPVEQPAAAPEPPMPKGPGPMARWAARSRGAAEQCIANARCKAADVKPRVKGAACCAGKSARRRGAAALAAMANGMQKQADKLAASNGTKTAS